MGIGTRKGAITRAIEAINTNFGLNHVDYFIDRLFGGTSQKPPNSEKSAETKQAHLQQLQIEHNQLTERYQELLLKQQDLETLVIQLQANEKMQQKQLEKSDRDLLSERQYSQSLNQQVAVLSEQLKRAQTDVTQAADKIEALRQEKLFLVQEKAQLDGAIKQLMRK